MSVDLGGVLHLKIFEVVEPLISFEATFRPLLSGTSVVCHSTAQSQTFSILDSWALAYQAHTYTRYTPPLCSTMVLSDQLHNSL